FILGGTLEVAEHVEIGARLPFAFAGFSPDGSGSRTTTAFGNLEIEGATGAEVAHGLKLEATLGVALPTAPSDEIPPDLSGATSQSIDQTPYDRFSLSRAAAAARGYEDNALFEPKRMDFIP